MEKVIEMRFKLGEGEYPEDTLAGWAVVPGFVFGYAISSSAGGTVPDTVVGIFRSDVENRSEQLPHGQRFAWLK